MVTAERLRIAGLWLCTLLFFGRVTGQVEVLLLEPPWLPPMEAWYSGLLPYWLLLPLQILLLMLMSAIAWDHWKGSGALRPARAATRIALRAFAAAYATAMLVRLIVALSMPPHELLASGIIPVAFHWVLAGFLLLVSFAPVPQPQASRAPDLVSDEELAGYTSLDERGRDLRTRVEQLLRARRLLDV
ncbi:MAG TPA: hypothetical protein VIL32_16880 [Steroidobacteraceae bacterium]